MVLGCVMLLLPGCGPDDTITETGVSHAGLYLHVATDGFTGNSGTAAEPLGYPANAVAQAYAEGYRGVKIAAGDYPMTFNAVGLTFYGGIDVIGGCDRQTWEPLADGYSTVYALDEAIEGLGIMVPTLIRGLEIIGTRARSGQETSSAVYLEGCSNELHFDHCRFTAQAGFDIPPRDTFTSPPARPIAPTAGGDGSCTEAVDAPGGRQGFRGSPGGEGGRGGQPGQPGTDGQTGWSNPSGSGLGGAGGLPGQPGLPGLPGVDGADSVAGEATPGLGVFNYHTIRPDRGGSSRHAERGSGGGGGGGGGGSATGSGNGGGAGGTGGDGGFSAGGGHGGGHSIAVLAVNCAATFRNCEFVSALGGRGGNGTDGSSGAEGTPGAPGGTVCTPVVGAGGQGGHGGDGGASGGGAGGNGGSCFGLLELGTVRADLDSTCTFSNGVPGEPGLGGRHGRDGTRATSGFPGESRGHQIISLSSPTQPGGTILEVRNPPTAASGHPAARH